ncbi:alpha/beta fold hydrolase [Rudaea sp.]|uniref:RBBP9/YdeN family alpha/beta hydrolase n=1 Tax=Rudaea sp. TaxID=2136325 RepID=UPI00322064EC
MNRFRADAGVLLLPGCGDSGPAHWQSLWEAGNPSFRRVVQDDWMHPVRAAWQARLEEAVTQAGPGTVLVAHSLGCLLAAHWAARTRRRVRAALLVAVPDPAGPEFPSAATGFAQPPMRPLPFKSLVVASRDDAYGGVDHARRCADAWGAELIDIGSAGHINACSGLGAWPQGQALLRRLRE